MYILYYSWKYLERKNRGMAALELDINPKEYLVENVMVGGRQLGWHWWIIYRVVISLKGKQ